MKTLKLSETLRLAMEEALDPERFDHTLGVAYTAANLAFVHGEDIRRAMTAGMLHDCAKCVPNEEKIRLCEQYGLAVSEAEAASPSLLHAKLGAYFAEHKYDVTDPEVLQAIRWHTTGRPGMTLLEKIVFVADYIEPNRKTLPHLDEIRREAYTDLDGCVLHILEDTIGYLREKAKVQDPMTRETLAYYRKERKAG